MGGTPVYLDFAAATPVDERVLAAMLPYFADNFYNPSATYEPARAVAQQLAVARASVAHWLGARPSEIIFTAGGTEANNLAVHGVMNQYPDGNIVVSAIEHEAILQPAGRYDCRQVAVDQTGVVQLEALRATIDARTVLVSIMYANNEIGTIEPLREVARIIQQERDRRRRAGETQPLYFHTDACQAANYLDLHAARLGVDLMTINGGKIYGPKQSGCLFVRSGVTLQAQILGGGQERGLRNGTENVAAAIGLATALDVAQAGRQAEVHRLQALQQRFISGLARQLPQAVLNGSIKKRLPNNVHITVPGQDNERLLLQLEAAGILAAAGSACSASSDEPSHVLRAIGLREADAQSSLRFSLGRPTTEAQIEQTVAALAALVRSA